MMNILVLTNSILAEYSITLGLQNPIFLPGATFSRFINMNILVLTYSILDEYFSLCPLYFKLYTVKTKW